MKNNRAKRGGGQSLRLAAVVAVVVSVLGWSAESTAITVAVVRSWGAYTVLPVFQELDENWAAYGTVPLTMDLSLKGVDSFTYEDLVNTDADVVWLSNPAGGKEQYSSAEIEAIAQYVSEGHSILGTYKVFQHFGTGRMWDNRDLATIFGLQSDIAYNTTDDSAAQAFNIVASTELFRDVPNPYVSSGYAQAQMPADDLSWDADDFGEAQLVARTSDNRGVITWYETGSYHAVYVSEMIEYNGGTADTQFLYNALTFVPEPSTLVLVGVGAAVLLIFRGKRGAGPVRAQRARTSQASRRGP